MKSYTSSFSVGRTALPFLTEPALPRAGLWLSTVPHQHCSGFSSQQLAVSRSGHSAGLQVITFPSLEAAFPLNLARPLFTGAGSFLRLSVISLLLSPLLPGGWMQTGLSFLLQLGHPLPQRKAWTFEMLAPKKELRLSYYLSAFFPETRIPQGWK